MSVPLCTYCQARPVRRARSNEHPKRGRRVINGIAWRWACSRACNGRINVQQALLSVDTKARVAKFRATYRQRRIARYIADCKLVMTADGMVPIKAMVRAMMEIERAAYSRGWEMALGYKKTGLLPRDAKRRRAA